MNKEFISYEQALALKELGFDEPCLAFWDGKNTDAFYFNNIRDASGDYVPFQKHDRLKWFGAPLYQQAFRWFREKYGICSWIERLYTDDHVLYYRYTCEKSIQSPPNYNKTWVTLKEYNTYEEAELECLKKLIEIVK